METDWQMRPSRGERERALALHLVLGLALTLFACGGVFFAYQIFDTVREAVLTLGAPDVGSLPAISAAPQPMREPVPNIAAGERVNVLVLGTDCRPVDRGVCRTDTMMIVTLDPKTATAGLVTIPRDLYVDIPGVGENRINTANYFGEVLKYPGGGPALAKKTVEYNLGRRIHYYVLADFNGFRKIVDTLGGIDIDVPRAIDDLTYPDENYGYKPIHIPAGRVHMNGEMALQYARTRHKDGDFGRMKRQIQVLVAIREKALRLDLLPKLPMLARDLWGTLETDMTPQEVLVLAPAAARVKTENIKSGSIDETMTVQVRLSSGAVVLWPDRVKIGQLMERVIPQDIVVPDEPSRIKQEAARVLVLNGSSTPGLAEHAAKVLQAQGFQVIGFGNADRFDYPRTVLIDYNGSKSATLTALAKQFRVDPANIRRSAGVQSDVDICVILGGDWTLPAEKTQP